MSDITPARWSTTRTNARSSYTSIYELFRVDAPAAEVASLFETMKGIRGAHRVEIKRNHPDYINGQAIESPWFSVYFRGTERAVIGARNALMFSGLQNLDANADHDHRACIANAAAMGVPAEYAHTPETYLSS
jgi:hypothetical protein